MYISKKVWVIGLSFLFSLVLLPRVNLSADTDQPTALPYQGIENWHIEIVDDNAKRNGAISFSSEHNPAIVYESDGANEQLLKYAIWSGTQWEISTIDNIFLGSPSASFEFDQSDNPHVSYAECQVGECDGKYGINTGSNWSITQNLDGYGSLAIDTNDNVHIGYHYGDSQQVRHMSLVGSSWITTTVDTGPIANMHVSIAIDNNDDPRVSYYKNDTLVHAARTSNLWSVNSVGIVPAASSLTGQFTALAVDSNNRSHIAYFDGTGNDLKYTYWNGFEWIKRTVDDSANVGKYVSLALDANDLPHILYYDTTNQAIKYAHQTSDGWRTITIEKGVGNGGATSIAIDGDQVHISYHVYNSPTERYIKYGNGVLTSNFYSVNLPMIVK